MIGVQTAGSSTVLGGVHGDIKRPLPAGLHNEFRAGKASTGIITEDEHHFLQKAFAKPPGQVPALPFSSPKFPLFRHNT